MIPGEPEEITNFENPQHQEYMMDCRGIVMNQILFDSQGIEGPFSIQFSYHSLDVILHYNVIPANVCK